MIILGIDGGGTKTDMLLADETGVVLNRVVGGPSNPSGQSIEMIERTLTKLVDELILPLEGFDRHIDSCYAGISGCGLQENAVNITRILKKILPQDCRVICGSDSINALNCGVGIGDGIAAIAGTGSNVVSRKAGVLRRVGGWGYLLGDEGSGYALGRMALSAVLRAQDGRGKQTLLSSLCEEQLMKPTHECVPQIYEGGHSFIASFSPLVPRAALLGDDVARAIIQEAAESLGEAIRTAGEGLMKPASVVLTGSVWANDGLMEKAVRKLLGCDYHLLRSALPPVYGAALQAAVQIKLELPEGFQGSIISGLGE